MDINVIKTSNKKIKKEIENLAKIISSSGNMYYYRNPGSPYEERNFEKYGIDIEHYISVFKKHNFDVWGEKALNESHSQEEDIVKYAGNCLTFISFFIMTDQIDTSTKSILDTIFLNNFPLLVNLNEQYYCLFEELFKSNDERISDYKNYFIKSFFEMIEQPTSEEHDPKMDFFLFWLTFNLHLIIRSNPHGKSLRNIETEDTKVSEIYLNMFFRYFQKRDRSSPQFNNHWIRGIARQIKLKHDLIKKPEQEKDINLQTVSLKLFNIHSRKGGVGKSTFAILIARKLLKKTNGKKICIIDFDSHGPALESYLRTRATIKQDESYSHLNEYFLGNIKTDDLSRLYSKISFNGIDNKFLTLISMSERAGDLDEFEWYLRRNPNRLFSDFEKKLKLLFAELQKEFDYVLIDTHPGLYGASQEIMKISYQLNGDLVFLVSPTFMDILGYGMEIENFQDLAGYKERFRFIMNKMHPETYTKLKEDPSSFEPIVMKHIKRFPSSVDDNVYINSCIKKFSGFFKEQNNLKFAPVQEYKELRHFYDIKINEDSDFEVIDKLEDLNRFLTQIVQEIV